MKVFSANQEMYLDEGDGTKNLIVGWAVVDGDPSHDDDGYIVARPIIFNENRFRVVKLTEHRDGWRVL